MKASYKTYLSAGLALSLMVSVPLFARGGGHHMERMAEMAAQYDTDGDGVVTQAEISAARTAAFQAGDSNADGYLSLDELNAVRDNMRSTRQSTRFQNMDTDSNGSLSASEFQSGCRKGDSSSAPSLFNLADSNTDGALSAEEFAALHTPEGRQLKRFARMDTNADGQISADEFAQAPMGRGGRRGQGRGF